MAAKKEDKVKLDYKDSSLHNDFVELKVLMASVLREMTDINKKMNDIHEVEMIRAGRM
jgi:hypothetical protein